MTFVTADEAQASLEQVPWSNGCRARKFFEMKRAFGVDMEIQPGCSSVSEVTNTVLVALLLRGDQVEVLMDGKTLTMTPGAQTLIPQGAYYKFSNTGASIAFISCVAVKTKPSRN